MRNLEAGPNRRQLLKYVLCGAFASALSGSGLLNGCRRQTSVKTPGIILISLDTVRADHLSCYGYKRPTCPTLDKIASNGICFLDASATSPWTLPSHGSMLTGFYPSHLGLHGTYDYQAIPQDVETIASVLSKKGYSTAAFINSFFVSEKFAFDKGFDKFVYVPEDQKPQGAAPVINKLAEKWVSKHKNEPLFLFLHYFDPHSDYVSQPEYRKLFLSPYDGPVDGTTAQLVFYRAGRFAMDQNDVKHLVELYDAEVRQLDSQLKNLFEFLDRLGLLENNYLMITADHGEEFLDHGGVLHGKTHYQEIIRIPLIISGPGIPKGLRIQTPASLVDIMPTVMDILSVNTQVKFDGYNLRPLWTKDSGELPDRLIFSENDHDNLKRSVRYKQYKLHYDLTSKAGRLYNLAVDPGEQIDIAGEQINVFRSLYSKLESFMKKSRKARKVESISPEELEKLKSLGYL